MDSGDLFFPLGSTPQSLTGKERDLFGPKIDLYVKAYNKMKYDAFTPGETDLSLGVQELLKISRQFQFTFLLANLIERRSKKPVFSSYRVKEVGGMKIGFFGLVSNNFHLRQSTGDREKYYLAEPSEIARKMVAELKAKGCNIIICLTHMEENEQKDLAQALKGVQFFVSGHVRNPNPGTQEVNSVEILKAGTRGEYMGKVEFFRDDKKLYSQYQIIPLDEKQPDQAEIAQMVQEYKTRLRALLPEPERRALERDHDSRPSRTFSFTLPSYVGDQNCRFCHPKQQEAWLKTAHSRAYATLVKERRTTDPTCLPCHTTGYGVADNLGDVLNLNNVQCESCHGPRIGHPGVQEELYSVSDELCQKCHNPAKSPNYNYKEYLAKIRCPSGQMAASPTEKN